MRIIGDEFWHDGYRVGLTTDWSAPPSVWAELEDDLNDYDSGKVESLHHQIRDLERDKQDLKDERDDLAKEIEQMKHTIQRALEGG